MELSLHTLKLAKNVNKKRKRVGRGNASGHGTYSTRGLKGQKSRTGGKNKLKRLGFKKILFRLPKSRGFKSIQLKNQVVNLFDINKHFKDGAKIDATSLFNANLINAIKEPIKILAKGELVVKNLELKNIKVSVKVKEQIEKLGGKIL
ncbi:MAG: 50S ribosomal protein L15 [Patescibacteria group bacterium]|nr:50S ribosomal protein L15 [Patescibacteria group bacterium]MBU1871040.1 50S ribosomal protein L15 [Patescibacteria group bacterium]